MRIPAPQAYLAIMTRVNSIIQLAQRGDKEGVAEGWDKLSDSVTLIVTSK